MFDAIPNDLKVFSQWVLWRSERLANGSVTKIPYDAKTGFKASVNNPSTWSSFFVATSMLAQHPASYSGLGFVLSVNDPFTFVDLDDKDGLKPDGTPKYSEVEKVEIAALQSNVYTAYAATYAEISPSGKGLHIIGRGNVPTGVRGKAIEIYSSERYMTMTGNVHRANPIVDVQAQNTWLWEGLGGTTAAPAIAAGIEGGGVETDTDENVYGRALSASNGAKFADLWAGKWEDFYPSQSEADFALIDILAFYTTAPAQIARLFRYSALGKRDKAKRDDYIQNMMKRAFDRLPVPIDLEGNKAALDAMFRAAQNRGEMNGPVRIAEREANDAANSILDPSVANPYKTAVPGLLGQLAYYIYSVSPRPVPEIALASAIGLMAGICGRSYNVNRAGLNQYIMLLAGTGRGKESLHNGISRLMNAVVDGGPTGGGCPGALEFIGPGDIASGQALVKYLDHKSKSFITVQGEFDITLKSFTSKNANGALLKLKQILLSAYSRSGKGQKLESTVYSEKEKNTGSVLSPAISLLGEGTPERFFDLLDESLIADGLLPRFTVIYYEGERVALNVTDVDIPPPPDLVRHLGALCSTSLALNQGNNCIDVLLDPAATDLMGRFDKQIDRVINAANSETISQIWNRAHLKALKLAALVAVGINMHAPVIDAFAAQYAIDLVTYDTKRLISKFASGDVGDSEGRQHNDARRLIARYIQSHPADAEKWASTAQMQSKGIIPKRMLQMRTNQLASFKNDRMGAGFALNRLCTSLLEAGIFTQVAPMQAEAFVPRGAILFNLVDHGWLKEAK